ncbi:cytochrome c-type biogenesis protein [Vibrio mangrovi]
MLVLFLMLGLSLLTTGTSAVAAIDVYDFHNEQQEKQFQALTHTLRCPKCQNNSIADSNAALAQDLRQKVYDMTMAGKSQQEIIDYMTARYGNFVTYNPPFTWSTAILWLAPLMIILTGLVFMFRRTRRLHRGSVQTEDGWGEEQESRLQALLTDDEQEEDKQ